MQTNGWIMRIASQDRTSVTLQVHLETPDEVSPNWYSTLLGCLTNTRLLRLSTKKSTDEILAWLQRHPTISIYTVVSHEPMLTPAEKRQVQAGELRTEHAALRQQMFVNGEPYIDEFGQYVYVVCRLGYKPDADLRYENPEPELFNLEHIEYDLPDRRSHGSPPAV